MIDNTVISVNTESLQPCIKDNRSYNISACNPLKCQAPWNARCECKIEEARQKAAEAVKVGEAVIQTAKQVLQDSVVVAASWSAPMPVQKNDHGLADCTLCAGSQSNGKTIICLRGHYDDKAKGVKGSYSLRERATYDQLRARYAWCGDWRERV